MKPARYKALLRIFGELSARIGGLSTCSRLKVGCVILSKDLRYVYGYGYNGNYAGGPNTCDQDVPGSCGCLHSEENALLKATNSDRQKIAIITVSPCKLCAKRLINSGISKVYYLKEYRSNEGLKVLKTAKIPYEKL